VCLLGRGYNPGTMTILKGFGLILGVAALSVWMFRITPKKDTDVSQEDAESWLMAQDADQINVRSADNVRLLSDEQLRALEEDDDEV